MEDAMACHDEVIIQQAKQRLVQAKSAVEQEVMSELNRNQKTRISQLDVNQMDTNKDGVVDAKEFGAAGGSKQEFDKYDVNGDGVLDADELARRSAAQAQASEDTHRMDTNKDGVVDEREFMAAGGSKQEFDKYDLNGDGVLDAREMELRGADKVDEQEHKIHEQEHAIAALHGREDLNQVLFQNRDAAGLEALILSLESRLSEGCHADEALHLRALIAVSKYDLSVFRDAIGMHLFF